MYKQETCMKYCSKQNFRNENVTDVNLDLFAQCTTAVENLQKRHQIITCTSKQETSICTIYPAHSLNSRFGVFVVQLSTYIIPIIFPYFVMFLCQIITQLQKHNQPINHQSDSFPISPNKLPATHVPIGKIHQTFLLFHIFHL